MIVILSFDQDLATQVSDHLDHLVTEIASTYQSHLETHGIPDENDTQAIQVYLDTITPLITSHLGNIGDERLSNIIINDFTQYLVNHPAPFMITSNPWVYLETYSTYTWTPIFNSGLYHLEVPEADRQYLDSLDISPSKKPLFIKYKLLYTIPDKLTQYLEAYAPIYQALEDIRVQCLNLGSIEAYPLLNLKYHLVPR